MESLSGIGDWISNNESLLSGAAAIIVLLGVIASALGILLRRLASKRDADQQAANDAVITLKDLSAPAPYPIHYAESDGLRIAYTVFGDGPRNILMAPGLISHLNIVSHMPPIRDSMLALSTFSRVLCFDKRGQGLSDPCLNVPDLQERVHDIEAVIDAAEMQKVILLGVSEGGPMCVKFAHDHPDRVEGLILLGTTARWLQGDDFPAGIEEAMLDSAVQAWGTGAMRNIFFPSISLEKMDEDTYQGFEHLIATRHSIEQIMDFMKNLDVRPLLPQLTCPTLVIHFSGDLAVPVRLGRAMADAIPNAEFLELPGIDHCDLSQAPEGVERVRQFAEALG